MNRDLLASAFQAVEQFDGLLVLEEMRLAALVRAKPVIGLGDAVPSQRDDQDLGLGFKQPLNLL
jgi:hypothetical protein